MNIFSSVSSKCCVKRRRADASQQLESIARYCIHPYLSTTANKPALRNTQSLSVYYTRIRSLLCIHAPTLAVYTLSLSLYLYLSLNLKTLLRFLSPTSFYFTLLSLSLTLSLSLFFSANVGLLRNTETAHVLLRTCVRPTQMVT